MAGLHGKNKQPGIVALRNGGVITAVPPTITGREREEIQCRSI
jgi:hypothetical protein